MLLLNKSVVSLARAGALRVLGGPAALHPAAKDREWSSGGASVLAVAVHGRQGQRKELQGTVGLQKHHRNRKMALRRARAVAPVDWCCLCCFSGFLCGAHAGIVRARFLRSSAT